MRRRRLTSLLAAAALVAAACSAESSVDATEPAAEPTTASEPTPDAEPEPTPTPAEEPTSGPDPEPEPTPAMEPSAPSAATPGAVDPFAGIDELVWGGCGGGFECASLSVPRDWFADDGETIEISVIRRPASGAAPRGSIFANPGGPGGSGVDFVRAGFRLTPELEDAFHLVSWDPRGVGGTEALGCSAGFTEFFRLDPSPDDAAEQEALDAAAADAARRCADIAGLESLGTVGTDQVVYDLEALRVATGAGPLDYLGFSYGTAIGLRYAETFGANAGGIVLDGVFDPSLDFEAWLTGQTQALDGAILTTLDSCGGLAPCPVDDPLGLYDQVVAAAEGGDLTTAAGQALDPGSVAAAAILTTYGAGLGPELIDALVDASSGDTGRLEILEQAYLDFGGFDAYTAVSCIDSPHPEGADAFADFADRLAELSPRFGEAVANELLACAFWPVESEPGIDTVRAAEAPPLLLVNATGDAATPYDGALAVQENLAASVLVTHEADGHTSFGRSGCVQMIVTAYFLRAELPAEGTVCRD